MMSETGKYLPTIPFETRVSSPPVSLPGSNSGRAVSTDANRPAAPFSTDLCDPEHSFDLGSSVTWFATLRSLMNYTQTRGRRQGRAT